MGERGPKGDHGQHGDTGSVGPSGIAGERGDEGLAGLPGERGPSGDAGPRGSTGMPGKDWRFGTHAKLRLFAYIVVAAASIYSAARTFQIADNNRQALRQIAQEGVERRDQSCTIAEREHLSDVERLRSTYLYLANLTDEDGKNSINQAVLVQLPQTEERARNDVAPDFCDDPGVGLPEPDPKVPERPAKVDKLFKQAIAKAK